MSPKTGASIILTA